MHQMKTIQPSYWTLSPKLRAREWNVKVYREQTGNYSIPADRQYWTLCNWQPPESGSEIVQMQEIGLIQKEQFVGVDISLEIIKQNRKWHPKSIWHCGDWTNVITRNKFNPALIYLDATNIIGYSKILWLVVSTMFLCSPDTVLIVNAMLNNPRSGEWFDPNTITREIGKFIGPEWLTWTPEVRTMTYQPARTRMISYAFYKKV